MGKDNIFLGVDVGGTKILSCPLSIGEKDYRILGEEMQKCTADEWTKRLDAADVPNARMNMLHDLISDAYLWETGFFSWYDHPSGHPHVAMAFPIDFSVSAASMTRPPPLLGEHNQEILGEFACDANDPPEICEANGD